MKIGGKGLPLFGINWPDFGNRFRGLSQTRTESFLGHIGAGETDDGVARPKSVVRGQVVHRGNNFSLGEVPGSAKQNYRARFRHSAVHRTGATCLPSHRVSFYPLPRLSI